MGIEDRDYSREPRRPDVSFGGIGMLSVTMWLIIINVVVFLLDSATTRYYLTDDGWHVSAPINQFGAFTANAAIFNLQLWRFVTFQFLHASFMHLFMNMLGLFFFGPLIENYLGRRRYLAFYLLCGIAGPLSFLVFYFIHLTGVHSWTPLIGASAGVFGVLIAGSQIAPNITVLIYGVIPARLRTVAWVLLGVAVYTVFTNGNNAGGEAAHLGGAAVGYLLIKKPRLLNVFEFAPRRGVRRGP